MEKETKGELNMLITDRHGETINSLEAWGKQGKPASASHWVVGRSAYELASDWIEFLRTKAGNNFEDRREVIERYRKRFKPEPLPHPESTWNQLQEIRGEILKLFEKADAIVRSAK